MSGCTILASPPIVELTARCGVSPGSTLSLFAELCTGVVPSGVAGKSVRRSRVPNSASPVEPAARSQVSTTFPLPRRCPVMTGVSSNVGARGTVSIVEASSTSPATLRMYERERSISPLESGTRTNGPAKKVSPGAISAAPNSRCWSGCSM